MSEHIELKDFIASYVKMRDNRILDALTDNITEVGFSYCTFVFDKEKCKKWILQALEIEKFSKEQIEDLKIMHLINKKDEKIKELEKEIEDYKNELEEIRNIIGE